MPRKPRVEYEGAVYHVMSRGERREPIFRGDADRLLFLKTLGQACGKTDWQVHAWCLMPDCFYLVLETPKANLSVGMKWFVGVYTGRFNRKHKSSGRLFSGRYRALIVDGSGSGNLRTVCDYVHLNPVQAKLLKPDQKLRAYRWSSYGEYLRPRGARVSWLRVDRLLGEMGIVKDSQAGRKEFERRMELRRREGDAGQWKRVRRGWCLGDQRFRKKMLAQMAEKVGASRDRADARESGEGKAQQIVRQELGRLGWTNGDLRKHRKGDRRKVRIAHRLRAETTMTLKWIAARLKMGTWTYLTNRLYHLKP